MAATKNKTGKSNVMKATKTAKEISLQQAQAKIDEQQKQDVMNCTREFNEAVKPILEKYGCTTVIIGDFVGANVRTSLQIVKAQ